MAPTLRFLTGRSTCASLVLLGVLLAISGCDIFSKDPAVINGVVLNAQTDRAIEDARVELLNSAGTRTIAQTATDVDGNFSFSVEIDSLSTFLIVASKTGFVSAETSVSVEAEASHTLRDPLRLGVAGDGGGGVTTGEPRSVTLAHRTSQNIGVSGSGSVETATLTFAVLDGNGVPLDAASSVTVRFRLLNQPSTPGSPGSEFIYPAEAPSDENGEAKVTLTSGVRSGPVQIQAEVDGPNGVIQSSPVVTTIHGGLPDQAHFTVAPVKRNFHGRTVYGIENSITVIAGDEYGNPVQAGTEIYFTTSHGVIAGSGSTDALGRTSSLLQAADPLPNTDGLGTITARTVGSGGVTVENSTDVLFSGPTQIQLFLEGGSLEGGGLQFRYVVSDDLGNPIEGGSSAAVTVEGQSVRALGHVNVTIPDARQPGVEVTEFNFLVRKSDADADDADLEIVQITVSSPNGDRTYIWMMDSALQMGEWSPTEIIVR